MTQIKANFSNLKWWQTTIMIVTVLLASGAAAYMGANVNVNLSIDTRLQMLEDQMNIPVNSTISAFMKEASYIISVHDVSGTPYYCMINGSDDRAGRLESYSTNASQIINWAIGNMTRGGTIFLKSGTYILDTIIDFGNKSICLEGEGGTGQTNNPTNGPVTRLRANDSSLPAGFLISAGVSYQATAHVQIRNLVVDGASAGGTLLGGIQFRNIWFGLIENVVVSSFWNTAPYDIGMHFFGDAYVGCYFNQVRNSVVRGCTIGIETDVEANCLQISGGWVTSGADNAIGIFQKDGSILINNVDMESFTGTNATGLWIHTGYGSWMYGARFEGNTNDVHIDSGVEDTVFIGGSFDTFGGKITDNGIKTRFVETYNIVTERSGTASSCVNGTWVTCNLYKVSTSIILTISGSTYVNSTSFLLEPTVLASNSTMFQIGFSIYNAGTITAVTTTNARDIIWKAECLTW